MPSDRMALCKCYYLTLPNIVIDWKTIYNLVKDGARVVGRLEAVLLLLGTFCAYAVVDLYVDFGVISNESWLLGTAAVVLLLLAGLVSKKRAVGDEWAFFVAAAVVSAALFLDLGAPLLAYVYPAIGLSISVVLYLGGTRHANPGD